MKRESWEVGEKTAGLLPNCLVFWGNKDKWVYEKVVQWRKWESKGAGVYEDKMRVVVKYCFALGDFSTRFTWSKWRLKKVPSPQA